jgi:hypothetical protein
MYAVLVIFTRDLLRHGWHDWTVVPYSQDLRLTCLPDFHRNEDSFNMTVWEVRNLCSYYAVLRDKYMKGENQSDTMADACGAVASHFAWLGKNMWDTNYYKMDARGSVRVIPDAKVKFDDKDILVRCSWCGKHIYYEAPFIHEGKLLCHNCSYEVKEKKHG